jgi:glucosamine--fructose-6-phosphate aminotransferase (isomerizing)
MCGIFGLVLRQDANVDREELLGVLPQAFRLAESRGKDAAGFAAVFKDRVEIVKRPLRARVFLREPDFRSVLTSLPAASALGPLVAIGHTRMVTNGSPDNPDNNQPVIKDGLICLHNGIIVNDLELWRAHNDLKRDYQVDTEALLAMVAKRRTEGASLARAVALAVEEARGANTIALLGEGDDTLLLGTTNGSLYIAPAAGGVGLMFASERYILEQLCKSSAARGLFDASKVQHVKPGNAVLVPFADPTPRPFALPRPGTRANPDPGAYPADARGPSRRIVDHRPAVRAVAAPMLDTGAYRALERAMVIRPERAASLKRCSKCLLPETFPFIEFDQDGACQFCRNPRPLRELGQAELEALVASNRRPNGQADCLVPVSGGRDSSYSLHYIKNVLGLNPVAYTYDWGMVTDLARRNISRMCEALQIEHILVAADIRRKREFIRMNVEAWLHRPHLGTIPLFMAGDKQFFYYSDMLSKQMNLPLVIFSQNRLERTDFKVGFCGINDTGVYAKHHDLATLSKVRMALFYAKEFALNPRLINASLLDSAFAYASFYVLPKRYIQLFDYIDWNEQTVQDTIINQYDWETAPDSHSTWRVGDGTASFYNYIYYKVTGFTEHDTFRSNQIRQGLITRERALELLPSENQPRVESFKWYCDTIGVDALAAVRAINLMPQHDRLGTAALSH